MTENRYTCSVFGAAKYGRTLDHDHDIESWILLRSVTFPAVVRCAPKRSALPVSVVTFRLIDLQPAHRDEGNYDIAVRSYAIALEVFIDGAPR